MSTLPYPAKRAGAIEDLLWVWLAAGILACLLFPSLRGHDPLLGWLPFWLVAAPLIDLGLLQRQRLLAASRTFLVRARRRRYRPLKQARRVKVIRRQRKRRQALLAALFNP